MFTTEQLDTIYFPLSVVVEVTRKYYKVCAYSLEYTVLVSWRP